MNVVVGQMGLPGNRFGSNQEIELRARELEQQVGKLADLLRPLDNVEGVDRVTWDKEGGIVSVDLRRESAPSIPEMKKMGFDVAEMSYEPTPPHGITSLDASGECTLGPTRLSVVPSSSSTRYQVDEGPFHYEITVHASGSIFCEGFDER